MLHPAARPSRNHHTLQVQPACDGNFAAPFRSENTLTWLSNASLPRCLSQKIAVRSLTKHIMNKSLLRLLSVGILFALSVSSLHAAKSFRDKLVTALTTCEYSLDVVMSKPETAVPVDALRQAKGIIIVHQYRVGLIFGGQAGSAVLCVRVPAKNNEWGAPVFLDPGGVSFGLQAGAKEINSVFLLMSEDAVRRAYSGRFELGADAVAVAGPRNSEVENFDLFKAPVLVYTSLGGLYAGAALKTGWLTPYEKGNRELYQTPHSTPEIVLSTWFETPPEAEAIVRKIKMYESGGQ
jgi:lipid-binding SYLF domain-containing protein